MLLEENKGAREDPSFPGSALRELCEKTIYVSPSEDHPYPQTSYEASTKHEPWQVKISFLIIK